MKTQHIKKITFFFISLPAQNVKKYDMCEYKITVLHIITCVL